MIYRRDSFEPRIAQKRVGWDKPPDLSVGYMTDIFPEPTIRQKLLCGRIGTYRDGKVGIGFDISAISSYATKFFNVVFCLCVQDERNGDVIQMDSLNM